MCIFFSCDSRKSQEENADKRLKHIQELIDQNSFNAAKNEIDSIHALFPMFVDKRRIAAALSDTVLRRESTRSLSYCDSILPGKIHAMDSIQKNFRFEKDKKYQEIGNFVYKTEQTENNANRTYLKTYVDENADFYLVSNYCGVKIEQQSVEVSVNELFAHSDTISLSDANNHRYDDGGSHFESIIFKNESGKSVVEFIMQTSSKVLKITLHGKKTYSYYLADADKKAIIETYRLWKVKKDVVQLQKEIKKATLRISRINNSKKSINKLEK
ncbi:MAG: hypothetical protein WCG08_02105 [Paludibacter sp.]